MATLPFRTSLHRPAALLLIGGLLSCGGEPGEDSAGVQGGAEAYSSAGEGLPEGVQAISFLGDTLYAPELSEEALARMEGQLAEALAELEADPQDADALIWVGRRAAYLGKYRRAIDFFTLGTRYHPDDARFLRHRGHRYISVRELDNAIADFSRAAEMIQGKADEVEPDGQPNALGIPTSTLQFNIWYHYGLAHFLKGEFQEALDKYRQCMAVSEHPDSKVATAHWLYMSLRRLGMEAEARDFLRSLDLDALAPDVIESGSYLELLRLYAGRTLQDVETEGLDMEGAALGYGYGNWLLYNGQREDARAFFQEMLDSTDQWASFGYIAAEAELARMAAEEMGRQR